MNLKNNLLDFKHFSFPWRKRKKKIFRVVLIVLIAVLALTALSSVFFYPYIGYAKEVYSLANEGKAELEEAQKYALSLNLEGAKLSLIKAEKNFNEARDEFQRFYIFKIVPFLGKQVKAVDNLLLTSIETTSAVREVVLVAQDIFNTIESAAFLGGQVGVENVNLSFGEISREQKRQILKTFFEAPPKLQGAKAKIDLAVLAFNQIPEDEVVGPIKKVLAPLQKILPELQQTITRAIPAAEVLPQILGYPEPKTYLFLLQNNSELRPTGGFIGTFGIVKLDSGELLTFSTDNIYKLDFAASDYKLAVEPPQPLKKYLGIDRWFLRDANWSPDFPESAEQALWFYNQEIQPHLEGARGDIWGATVERHVDGIIAITPEIIKDLLDFFGDIEIEGQTFTSDNLVDILEYQVGKAYVERGIPDIQRKEVVGKLATELKNKLFSLPASQWPTVLSILKNNLNEKHILIYDKSPDLQFLIRENNWGGEVLDYEGDYLMVIDANLASLKTDQVMSRKIGYNVSARGNELIGEVKITYTNRGEFSWKTTRYRTYTRVYVPRGSELMAAEGMMENDKIKDPGRKKGTVDEAEEFGKAYFGAFISVEPGETRSLSFKYRLPDYIANQYDLGLYKLFVQKQSGTEGHSLTIDLDFDKKIKSWLPLGYSSRKMSDKQMKFIYSLREDRESIVQF